MTAAEIEAVLAAHHCWPWPRGAWFTVRCHSCHEIACSTHPIAAGDTERRHQAIVLARLVDDTISGALDEATA